MGIYINGMEMPKDGVYLCEIGVAGDIATLTIHGGIEEERKAYSFIAVPDHGDLIDAHSLKIRLGKRFSLDKRRVMEIVRETVDTAKVVIPAERSKE